MPIRPSPTLRRALALALVAGLAACSRCSGKANRPTEEFVDPATTLAATVPHVGQFADRAQAVLATARSGAGGDRLVQLSAALAMQLGFDPLTREGLKAAGIDPNRSLSFGASPSGRQGAFAIVPFDDQATLEATVERLARDRAGAGVKEERAQDDVKVTVLTPVAGGPALLAYAARDGFLLVGGGDDAVQTVAEAMKRAPAQSLAASAPYVQAKTKLGARDLYAFLPKAQASRGPALPGAAALGLSLTGNEIAARLAVDLAPDQLALLKIALVGGGEGPLAVLPKGAPVYLRGALDWAGMLKKADEREELSGMLAKAREASKEIGIDLDAELFGNVEPGFAVAFGIASTANLSSAFDFDPRRSNPLENYTVLGVGRVKDEEKAKATLEKIGAIVEQFGTSVSAKEVAGTKTWTASYRLGEGLSWTLRGKELVVAGGFGEGLAATLTALGDKAKVVSGADFAPRAKEALFAKQGLALAIDFGRIGETVESLPSSAFGTGPGALMARSVASGVIKPLARLKAVGAVAPSESGVLVDVSVAAQ